MAADTLSGPVAPGAFRHEALLYAGEGDFLAQTVPFLREAAAAGEPTLVVVDAARIRRLRADLNGESEAILFADMAEVGANPARIIPAWHRFVAEYGALGRPLRGIGEPIWAGRSPDELVECQRHEALLNLAFADAPSFRLVCPYDTEALDAAVIDEARRSHPVVGRRGAEAESAEYVGLDEVAEPFDAPLPPPPASRALMQFGPRRLGAVRRFVIAEADRAGLGRARVDALVVAINELATNSVRHGGGRGSVSMWCAPGSLVFEVRDRGRIDDPLAGRSSPDLNQDGGRGLWIVNQLCDLVQIRTREDGTAVRVHMHVS
ncbi:MAG: putative anti-sigma factor kinase [Acidimicrobiales bacterium]|nr:putative anti-sigma factor kinase [Acidimicrobiales bacterium]